MEPPKRHDNTFSLQNVLFIFKVSAVLAFSGYCGYPTIINVLEGVELWFGWFRLFLRNVFFVFIIINALIGSIYFSFLQTTGKTKPDLYDEYIAAVPSVVRPSPEPSSALMEVGDYGGEYNNKSSYYETVPQFQEVNKVVESKCYERVVMETSSKSYRKTTSDTRPLQGS
ncbi:Transmembrane protein [Hirschfeldia incana]|nr:Transmembrane protein [Hirschfeldia incana]